jgi:hypothetical protein
MAHEAPARSSVDDANVPRGQLGGPCFEAAPRVILSQTRKQWRTSTCTSAWIGMATEPGTITMTEPQASCLYLFIFWGGLSSFCHLAPQYMYFNLSMMCSTAGVLDVTWTGELPKAQSEGFLSEKF